jgi:hypothetical protein
MTTTNKARYRYLATTHPVASVRGEAARLLRSVMRCRECGRQTRWTCEDCAQCDHCCVHWDYES